MREYDFIEKYQKQNEEELKRLDERIDKVNNYIKVMDEVNDLYYEYPDKAVDEIFRLRLLLRNSNISYEEGAIL